MSGVEHAFLVANGLRLHRIAFGGSGRPILLVHGVGGTAWIWHAVAPALVSLGRPIAVDLRGFGLSQRAAHDTYTTDQHADDSLAVVEALESDQVDVVGFSWGALVALALTTRTSSVRRLALVDMPPASPLSETDVNPLPFAFETHAQAVEAESRIAPRADPAVLDRTVALLTLPDDEGLTRGIDPFFLERWPFRSDDRWDDLRAHDGPLLVVRAEHSAALGAEEAQRMVSEAQDGRLAIVRDCGHLVPVERPVELARILGDFLSAA